jgi:hypothetical protein
LEVQMREIQANLSKHSGFPVTASVEPRRANSLSGFNESTCVFLRTETILFFFYLHLINILEKSWLLLFPGIQFILLFLSPLFLSLSLSPFHIHGEQSRLTTFSYIRTSKATPMQENVP